MSKFLK